MGRERQTLINEVSAGQKAYGAQFNATSKALAFLDEAKGYLAANEPDAAEVQLDMAMSHLASVSSGQGHE